VTENMALNLGRTEQKIILYNKLPVVKITQRQTYMNGIKRGAFVQ